MALAGSAEAHDEAEIVRAEAILAGVGDDGGVEKRGGFERVFTGEEGADEEPPGLGKVRAGGNMRADFLKMTEPALIKVDVPAAKIRAEEIDLLHGLRFVEGPGADDDILNTDGIG
jgi:hypothetical protein